MYQRMNLVLQNEALVFPQEPVIDDNVVTNPSDLSEGCVTKQPREPLNTFNHEGNQSIEPNGKQLEQEYLRKLDSTRRHETIEMVAF